MPPARVGVWAIATAVALAVIVLPARAGDIAFANLTGKSPGPETSNFDLDNVHVNATLVTVSEATGVALIGVCGLNYSLFHCHRYQLDYYTIHR
jgi:hypothetical protein